MAESEMPRHFTSNDIIAGHGYLRLFFHEGELPEYQYDADEAGTKGKIILHSSTSPGSVLFLAYTLFVDSVYHSRTHSSCLKVTHRHLKLRNKSN